MSLLKKIFLSFCLCFPLIAAQVQYHFDVSAENGLPQNTVNNAIGNLDFTAQQFTPFLKFK